MSRRLIFVKFADLKQSRNVCARAVVYLIPDEYITKSKVTFFTSLFTSIDIINHYQKTFFKVFSFYFQKLLTLLTGNPLESSEVIWMSRCTH